MRVHQRLLLFCLGGGGYVCLELLWRGRSHGSMFFLGGLCFCLMGKLRRLTRLCLWLRLALGALCVTALELAVGLTVNREHQIWDYRTQPFHFRGQICLLYSLLWIPVCFLGMLLYGAAEKSLPPGKR